MKKLITVSTICLTTFSIKAQSWGDALGNALNKAINKTNSTTTSQLQPTQPTIQRSTKDLGKFTFSYNDAKTEIQTNGTGFTYGNPQNWISTTYNNVSSQTLLENKMLLELKVNSLGEQTEILKYYRGSDRKQIAELTLKWTVEKKAIPQVSVSAEEQKCYDFINMCVQECNGQLVFQQNFHQLDARFTPQGFFAETDFPDTDHHTQYDKKDIKWGHLKNTNVQELNFRYSIICIQFVKNFELKSRTGVKNMYSGQGAMWGVTSKDVCFGIIVKKERVKECVDMIYQLFNLAKSKEPQQSLQLTKKEQMNNGSLETYYIDQNENLQGKYELLDGEGKVYISGNYKDNAKVGYWIEGRYRGMYENDHQVGKWNNSAGSITTFDRDGNADVGGRRRSVDFCLCEIY